MRFQVPPKTFILDGQTVQRTRHWVPNRRTDSWESPGANCAATKPWNIQLVMAGQTVMLVAGNFWDWHAAVGEVPWSAVPTTQTTNSHGKLLLHSTAE